MSQNDRSENEECGSSQKCSTSSPPARRCCYTDEMILEKMRQKGKRDVSYTFSRSRPSVSKKRKAEKMTEPSLNKEQALATEVVEPVDHLEEAHTEDSLEATSDDCVNVQAPVLSGVSSEINLEPIQRYAHMLVLHRSIICTRYVIAMARRNSKAKENIDGRSFVGVIRLSGKMYCSCDVDGLERALTATSHCLEPEAPSSCLHIDVLRLFGEMEDLHEWVYPENREECDDADHGYSVMQNYQVIEIEDCTRLIYTDRRFGTVRNGKCDCINHRGPCPFLRIVPSETAPQYRASILSRQTSLSWKRISFTTVPRSDIPPDTLTPTQCSYCSSTEIDISERISTLPMYTLNGARKCNVRIGECRSCSKATYADGGDQAIMNMGNFLIHHSVMIDYMRTFLISGMPLFSFYKLFAWKWTELSDDDDSVITYHRFRVSWLAFNRLLDFGNSHSANFICSTCGDDPETVVCDGITLSLERRFLLIRHHPSKKETLLNGSRFDERILIPNYKLRKALRSKTETVDDSLLAMAQATAPWLIPILEELKDSQLNNLPTPWKQFFRDVSASTPAIAFIDPTYYSPESFLDILEHGITIPENLKTLKQSMPSIYNVVRAFPHVLPQLKPTLHHLIDKILVIANTEPHQLGPYDQATDHLDSLPNLPPLTRRGHYRLDAKKQKVCTKNAPKHKTLTSGIFTMSCPHGICYGFELMPNQESPNIPLTILRTRFSRAPRVVIYDNSCNLHDYCLNRDPGFFKDTKFFVDRFHWVNHKECSSGYDVRLFEKYTSLNTQVAEQLNSKIAKLRNTLSYCNEENFREYLSTFIWFQNTLKLLAIREPANEVEQALSKVLHILKR